MTWINTNAMFKAKGEDLKWVNLDKVYGCGGESYY